MVRSLVIVGLVGLACVSRRGLAADDSARGQQGVVACVSRPASEAGLASLQRGGSAVDAAVTMAFALAVTYPAAGNIGGGGYMLIVPGNAGAQGSVIDFREVAPAAATRDMFVDSAARTPHRRVGVPGTVRGLAAAHQRYGRLPWSDLVAPAVRLAREGFALDAAVAAELNEVLSKSDKQTFGALHQALGRADGRPWRLGDQLVQAELADVLAQIAERGADAFYTGQVAELIAAEMRRGAGLVTEADLAQYQPVVREPLLGTYRDCELLAVPPSSSGGTTLLEALNILEAFDLNGNDRFAPSTLHAMIESSRRAYRDRAAHLGDPAMTAIPGNLVDKNYARQLAAGIDLGHATPSAELAGEIDLAPESPQTTHLSVMDRDRMAVSLTYTLEQSFGSRVVVSGGGFLLNDEMNDFNWLPGVTDRTGRIGTEPNVVAPGKRMLSSMCPLVIRRDGRTVLVTGSPGGRTIINTVLNIVVNVVDYHMDVRQAVDAPRLHQAWFPDQVQVEPELAARYPQALQQLKAMGHTIADRPRRQGDAHSVWVDPRSGQLVGAADRRISGCALAY
jgi:gamma-glutamyltranspeptidase/glutathione hydrolase